jgi:hypothetical protein
MLPKQMRYQTAPCPVPTPDYREGRESYQVGDSMQMPETCLEFPLISSR